jgi:oligopeptide transport system ATP-binding protein
MCIRTEVPTRNGALPGRAPTVGRGFRASRGVSPSRCGMTEKLLSVQGLRVDFGRLAALADVSLDLQDGETLGLVGESGSGKSTLARAILRLIPVSGGRVLWRGEDLLGYSASQLRQRRRDLQIVFQDPLASLNPRMTVGAALAETLKIFEPKMSAALRDSRVAQMLERVGLEGSMASRYPHEFSGGQCQRIGVARAMMSRPQLLICDEPVSSLDVSIQGQIVNLLVDLQRELGMAMLFISHNLAVVRHLSHRVAVIYRGRLVEVASRDDLFAAPAHPYTRALLDAVPDPWRATPLRAVSAAPTADAPFLGEPPAVAQPPAVAELPAAGELPSGCAFRDRCPYVKAQCADTVPAFENVDRQHIVACHRWREVVYS